MVFSGRERFPRAFGMAVAALAAGLVASAFGAELPPQVIPDNFSVQLKPACDKASDLDAVRDAGFKFVRHGFIWASVEKTKGQYDFSAYDRLVKDCRDRGIGIIGCIAFANPLYGNNTVLNDEGRQAYANFAAALAEHFKGENILWEIWNEPNVRTFWGKHGTHNSQQYASEYLALVKATVPAMKKADPKCFVMGGAVSGVWSASYAWTGFCFQMGMLKTGIDAWSVHPYSTHNPEDYVDAYATIRDLMTKNGGPADFPMINSERGYPIKEAEGFTGGDDKMVYEYQAWQFVRQYLVDQMLGIKLTSWYEWAGTEGFALMEHGQPTQALKAGKVMVAELAGYHFDKRIDLPLKRDFVLQFTSADGGTKLVAWAAPPKGETPDETKPHAVEIPVAASGELPVVQIYGDKGTVQAGGSSIPLKLTGAPQYITLKSAH